MRVVIYVNVFQFSALWISRDGKVQKKVQKKGECMILWLVPPSLESGRHTNSIPFIIIALVMINLHKLLCPSGHIWLLQWIQTLFVVPFRFLCTYIFTRYFPTLNFDKIKIISHRIEKTPTMLLEFKMSGFTDLIDSAVENSILYGSVKWYKFKFFVQTILTPLWLLKNHD